jgi:hypothetical protein
MKVGAQLLPARVEVAAIKAAVRGLLVFTDVGGLVCLIQRP